MFKPTLIQRTVLKSIAKLKSKYILLRGGSRSGKTLLICSIFVHLALKFPGSRFIILRFSKTTANNTIWLQTLLPYLEKYIPASEYTIVKTKSHIVFKNGSRIMLDGLEPSRISHVLGGEYDGIFVNEANENKFEIIDLLFSRLNAKAVHYQTGQTIIGRIFFDLNPTHKNSWDYKYFFTKIHPIDGTPLKEIDRMYTIRMNPADNLENLNPDYIKTLESYGETNQARFLKGEYRNYSGLIYSMFDPDTHIIDDFKIPSDGVLIRSIDFGFQHPFVCLWGCYDRANEELVVYRELYLKHMTVRRCAEAIHQSEYQQEHFNITVADHDAGDRATLEENGIHTSPANKLVDTGIDLIIDDLHRVKIKIVRSCPNLINEFYSYRSADLKITQAKWNPVKELDDGLDALRYMRMAVGTQRLQSTNLNKLIQKSRR